MSVSLEAKRPATKSAPEQQNSGGGNYQQRDQLLPVHDGKITPKSARATKDFKNQTFRLLASHWQNAFADAQAGNPAKPPCLGPFWLRSQRLWLWVRRAEYWPAPARD
jgi:hypothetical protein